MGGDTDGAAVGLETALDLICINWKSLKAVDPKNDLLKFISEVNPPHHSPAFKMNETHWDEFVDMFTKKAKSEKKWLVFTAYAKSLEEAYNTICKSKGLDPFKARPEDAKGYLSL